MILAVSAVVAVFVNAPTHAIPIKIAILNCCCQRAVIFCERLHRILSCDWSGTVMVVRYHKKCGVSPF